MPHFRVTLEQFACRTATVWLEAADAIEAQRFALATLPNHWVEDPENVSKVMVREVERDTGR